MTGQSDRRSDAKEPKAPWWLRGYETPDFDPPVSMPDLVTRYDKRQEFEHTLIDRKVNWMFAVQGLLFTAYGLATPDEPSFQRALAWLGIVIALLTLLGVRVHQISKYHAWQELRAALNQRELGEDDHKWSGDIEWGVITGNTRVGVYLDALTPLVFVVAWGFVLKSI